MSAAPQGAEVKIYYDGPSLAPGDALCTRTGRVYGIVHVRVQERGKHAGRQHLRCVVLELADVLEGTRVFPLVWYKRG